MWGTVILLEFTITMYCKDSKEFNRDNKLTLYLVRRAILIIYNYFAGKL